MKKSRIRFTAAEEAKFNSIVDNNRRVGRQRMLNSLMTDQPDDGLDLTDPEQAALEAGTFVKVDFPCEDAVYLFTVITLESGMQIAHLKLLGPSCEDCSADLSDYYQRSISPS